MRSESVIKSRNKWDLKRKSPVRSPKYGILLALCALSARTAWAGRVTSVEALAIPVSNLERSVAFFTDVLSFQKVNETQVTDRSFAQLHGLYKGKPRIAWLKLGDEYLVLVDYGAARGRSIPLD